MAATWKEPIGLRWDWLEDPKFVGLHCEPQCRGSSADSAVEVLPDCAVGEERNEVLQIFFGSGRRRPLLLELLEPTWDDVSGCRKLDSRRNATLPRGRNVDDGGCRAESKNWSILLLLLAESTASEEATCSLAAIRVVSADQL